jgi:hypothetical protein
VSLARAFYFFSSVTCWTRSFVSVLFFIFFFSGDVTNLLNVLDQTPLNYASWQANVLPQFNLWDWFIYNWVHSTYRGGRGSLEGVGEEGREEGREERVEGLVPKPEFDF